MEDANGSIAMYVKAAAGWAALFLTMLIVAATALTPFAPAVAGGGGW